MVKVFAPIIDERNWDSLVDFIIQLRQGNRSQHLKSYSQLSLASISRITGLGLHFVKKILNGQQQYYRAKFSLRGRSYNFTQPQIDYLLRYDTLKAWQPYSLHARVQMFKQHFKQTRITVYKLRQLYKQFKIRLRVAKSQVQRKPWQVRDDNFKKTAVLPRVLDLFQNNENVVFVDEAVYSSKQTTVRVWHPSGGVGPILERNKLSFEAIAAVAGIDFQGRIVGLKTSNMSIKENDFADLLQQINTFYSGNKSYVFLDNLHMHHSKNTAALAAGLNIQLLFNAPVSSYLNPIERLWAHSKRIFRISLLNISDFKDQAMIEQLVWKSIVRVPADSLARHVATCLNRMEAEINNLNPNLLDLNRNKRIMNGSQQNYSFQFKPFDPLVTGFDSFNFGAQQHADFKAPEDRANTIVNNQDMDEEGEESSVQISESDLNRQPQIQPGKIVRVPVQSLQRCVQSKDQLYYALAVKGQLYLPRLQDCSMRFISDLLKGKKRAFKQSEVKHTLVPVSPWLTVKKVIEMILGLPSVLQYLPDKDELNQQRTHRDYLFTIVNTLDPDFFPAAITEIEDLKGLKIKKDRIQTIEIDENMLKLLESTRSSFKPSKNHRISIGSIALGCRKRKRPDTRGPLPELTKKIKVI